MLVDANEVQRVLLRMEARAEKLRKHAAATAPTGADPLEFEAVGIAWAAGVLKRAMDKRPIKAPMVKRCVR